MTELNYKYKEEKEVGIISFEAKHCRTYYEKNKLYYYGLEASLSTRLQDFRYINWSDLTGFVPAKHWDIRSLCHKYPTDFIELSGFDHTSYWKRSGERFPLFCLTEPYKDAWENKYANHEAYNQRYKDIYNLRSKAFAPSPKSLWYPERTYMIFWWCPDYFDFDANEKLIFSHEDADQFEKRCIKKLI